MKRLALLAKAAGLKRSARLSTAVTWGGQGNANARALFRAQLTTFLDEHPVRPIVRAGPAFKDDCRVDELWSRSLSLPLQIKSKTNYLDRAALSTN